MMVTTVGAPSAASPLTVQVISGFDSLPALEHDWRRLFEVSDSEPSTSFEWTQALAWTQVNPTDAC